MVAPCMIACMVACMVVARASLVGLVMAHGGTCSATQWHPLPATVTRACDVSCS